MRAGGLGAEDSVRTSGFGCSGALFGAQVGGPILQDLRRLAGFRLNGVLAAQDGYLQGSLEVKMHPTVNSGGFRRQYTRGIMGFRISNLGFADGYNLRCVVVLRIWNKTRPRVLLLRFIVFEFDRIIWKQFPTLMMNLNHCSAQIADCMKRVSISARRKMPVCMKAFDSSLVWTYSINQIATVPQITQSVYYDAMPEVKFRLLDTSSMSPTTYKANISTSSILLDRGAPLNSCHMNTPQPAATRGFA